MTGTPGFTTVPLPDFWSKNDVDRRSPRKEHPRQRPRCAANSMACSTPHKEPPAKRIKRPLKKAKPDKHLPVASTGCRTELETYGGIKALGSCAAKFSDSHFAKNSSPISSRGIRPELETCRRINAFGNNTGRNSDCRSSKSLSTISSKSTRTELETCRRIKGPGKHSGKLFHCCFGKNLGTIFPKHTRAEFETSVGIEALESRAGKIADSNVGNMTCTFSSNRINTELESRAGIVAHGGPAGKYEDCTVANNFCPSSPSGTGNELENCIAITELSSKGGKRTDYGIALAPRTVAKLRRPVSVKSFKGVIEDNSKKSTTPMSSSSHALSIPTPIGRPSKPSKMTLAPQSVLEGSLSRGSFNSGRYSLGTSRSLPACSLSESMDNTIDDQITRSFLRAGRIPPPNSEKDEEDSPIEELGRHKPTLASPLYNALPIGSSSTSRWPPTLQAQADPFGRSVNLASSKNSTPSNLPPQTLTGIRATMPRESSTKCTRATPTHCSTSALLSKSSECHSGSSSRFGTSEATKKGIRPTPIHRSSSLIACEAPEGQTGSRTIHPTPKIKHMKCGRTPSLTRQTKSNKSTRSSTLATMGSAAQMHTLEQRLEDEDRQSTCSHNTLGKDSPKESSCTDLSSTRCGGKPTSAFYNALYAPECTLSGTKALEAHLHRHERGVDATLKVALEMAMLSVTVTILLLVVYHAITKGLRSQLYDCCPCIGASGSAVPQNPSQRYPQASWNDGFCEYYGEGNLLKCSQSQRTMGSTVVK